MEAELRPSEGSSLNAIGCGAREWRVFYSFDLRFLGLRFCLL